MTVDLQPIKLGVPPEIGLAVVIAGSPVTGSKDQRHAGFLVQYPDNTLWLFDLAWDNICRRTEITNDYAYLNYQFLDEFSATAFIALLHMIQSQNQGKLGYSIHYESSPYFDTNTGQALNTGAGQGLTCATFVLETLERYGIFLIDRLSWPISPDNAHWQRNILLTLISRTKPPLSIDKFTNQFKFIGKTRRFKPEEAVAATSIFTGTPSTFQAVNPLSQTVIDQMEILELR
ncbi:hypothetical protein [Pseudomonas sp. ML96]|uniref:hypothetical protein n=1 Tax=Pseudomonas sp. ML96 TaxID=1523503 RepID=UPI0012E02424|nr:hypothetical protein [Pseudomonas sp. ML96]